MKLSRRNLLMRVTALAATTLAVFAGAYSCRGQEQAQPAPSPREEFRKLVTAGRKPAELKPTVVSKTTLGTVISERVRFTVEEGQEAVALVFRPKEDGKYPAVIAQHFLGGTKDHLLFAAMLNGLAQRGFVAVAIDGRYRGERQNGKTLGAAMAESLKTGKGHPWLIDTVYDVTRTIDYVQQRPDVDPERIGMTGISEGGIITWMTAALDDRIKVAAPVIGVTSFAESLPAADDPLARDRLSLLKELRPALKDFAMEIGEPEVNSKVIRAAWQRLVPGGLDRFDGPSLIPTIAPRPLLVMNHEKDELFSIAGAEKVAEITRSRYKELMAEDRFEFKVQPGLKHADVTALFTQLTRVGQWMERWLKPGA